jgi:hypothetical protein
LNASLVKGEKPAGEKPPKPIRPKPKPWSASAGPLDGVEGCAADAEEQRAYSWVSSSDCFCSSLATVFDRDSAAVPKLLKRPSMLGTSRAWPSANRLG